MINRWKIMLNIVKLKKSLQSVYFSFISLNQGVLFHKIFSCKWDLDPIEKSNAKQQQIYLTIKGFDKNMRHNFVEIFGLRPLAVL